MIQCDICRDWLHGECVRLDEIHANDIDKLVTTTITHFTSNTLRIALYCTLHRYHCPRCTPLCGPSILKAETNWHRHDRTDPNATYKPLQVFISIINRTVQ